MAANSYTTADLVTNVKLVGHVPISNSTFTAPEIINLANRELQTAVIKQITSVREGYYMTYEDLDLADDGLYDVPANAIGGALANIELIQNTTIIPVNRIEESEQFSTTAPTSTSYGFFMKANKVQILPTPNIGTPRLWYFRRPNTLVETSDAAQITAIVGNVVSVTSLPSTMLVGTDVDFCQDQPTFNVLGTLEIASISSLDITLTGTMPTGLAVGDWMCLENQTPVPQIPVEFRPLLEQRVVVKIYELQGYLDKMRAAKVVLDEMTKDIFGLITPRVQSQTKIIMPVNGGFMCGRGGWNFPAGRTQ